MCHLMVQTTHHLTIQIPATTKVLEKVSFCHKTLFSHKKYINTLVTFKNQFIKLKKTLKRSKNTKLNQVIFSFLDPDPYLGKNEIQNNHN